MRNFSVIELMDYTAFQTMEAYNPYTIYYWRERAKTGPANPGDWYSHSDDILGGAIMLDRGEPMMLMNTRIIHEIVSRQLYGSGGGSTSKVITLRGLPDPDSSGSISSYRVPMSAPSPYDSWIYNDDSWVISTGSIVSVKGIINIAAINYDNDQELFMSWEVSSTFAAKDSGEVITLSNDVRRHSMPEFEESWLWNLDLDYQSRYVPSPEEIEQGATIIPANFCVKLNSRDYASYNAHAQINGELAFTQSTYRQE